MKPLTCLALSVIVVLMGCDRVPKTPRIPTLAAAGSTATAAFAKDATATLAPTITALPASSATRVPSATCRWHSVAAGHGADGDVVAEPHA